MGQIHMERANMPETPRSRRLEGQFHRCRRPEVAPPQPRQEFHLPQGYQPLVHCRTPLRVWVPFIRLMRHNVPVECATELCGVTHKTAFEWRYSVLATVSDYQDRIVLYGTV